MTDNEKKRYINYVGQHDVAKVEEQPFEEGLVTCMVLNKGHLKGRDFTPDQARELATSLMECANQAEERVSEEDNE